MKKFTLSLLALAAIIATPAVMAGPIMIGIAPIQPIHVMPSMTVTQPPIKLLSMYRSIRSFWVARAIVR